MMCSFKFAKTGLKMPVFLRKQYRRISSVKTGTKFEAEPSESRRFPTPVFDVAYYCNPANRQEIQENVRKRKCKGDIDRVLDLNEQLSKLNINSDSYKNLKEELWNKLFKLPNNLHNSIKDLEGKPLLLRNIGIKKKFNFKPKEFSEISKHLHLARNDHLSNFTDNRSYFFMGQLAEMESALVKFSLKNLLSRGFQLISAPDIINRQIIESCGMETEGDRTQVL